MQGIVDEQGRLVLPPQVAKSYGFRPGAAVELLDGPDGLQVKRSSDHLAKLYIEPTSACNLNCRTCIRNEWGEALGKMSWPTFQRIMAGLREVSPPPTVFFGGFGEPLTHPRIVEMVIEAKSLGGQVEMITNGMLLNHNMARRLIASGLDRLWVSVDGALPESYAEVREGANLPQVLANVQRFSESRPNLHLTRPELGIAFVAMRSNIHELPELLQMASRLGAVHFMVTNVLPYTQEMRQEVLYERVAKDVTYLPSVWVPHLRLPKVDITPPTWQALFGALTSHWNVSFAGSNLGAANDRCPFIAQGAAAVGWDGRLSPCLPLLHSHTSYLDVRERQSVSYSVGSIAAHPLGDLWRDPDYVAFRKRVQQWDFPPCHFCGGCELSFANNSDCFGNDFPTCGGCLWAQGLIQCP